MVKLRELLTRLRSDERGATAIEYGLLAALIAVGIIAAVSTIGDQLSQGFQSVADTLGEETGFTEEAPVEPE